MTSEIPDNLIAELDKKMSELISEKKLIGNLVNVPEDSAIFREKQKVVSQRFSQSLQFLKDLGSSVLPLTGKKVLDVGSGVGGAALAFACFGAQVCAIDVDDVYLGVARDFLAYGKERLKSRGVSIENICPVKMSAESLAFSDSSFDLVFCSDVFEHIPCPIRALKEVNRVLKKNGILLIRQGFALNPDFLRRDPHYGLPLVTLLPRLFRYFVVVVLTRRCRELRDKKWPLTHKQLSRWLNNTGNYEIVAWQKQGFNKDFAFLRKKTADSVIMLNKK